MNKLFYVRHGQATSNVNNVFGGHSEAILSRLGEDQARKAGMEVKEKLPMIDVIISSPLSRAYSTAQLIAKELEYPPDKIELNPLFIERSYGVLEGTKTRDFFDSHEPEEIDGVQGAETAEQLIRRANEAAIYIKSREEGTILVVSHGSFGNAFISVLKRLPYSYGSFDNEPKNGEIVELI